MLLVSETGTGVVSVNWMVLPVFLAQDLALVRAVDMELNAKYASHVLTPAVLVEIDEAVRELITKKYGIEGLDKYLEGLSHVRLQGEESWLPQNG